MFFKATCLQAGFILLGLWYPSFLGAADEAGEREVDNMHHFMEYVFEPRYKEIKETINLPPSKPGFKKIKSCGLTLAEAANLLMRRTPEDATEEEKLTWVRYAYDVREHAASLYQAAREKNHSKVVATYRQTIGKCNACHQQFADGKYQLSP